MKLSNTKIENNNSRLRIDEAISVWNKKNKNKTPFNIKTLTAEINKRGVPVSYPSMKSYAGGIKGVPPPRTYTVSNSICEILNTTPDYLFGVKKFKELDNN